MLAIGFLRLGTYIKYIPYPVTAGFTAGIAVIILSSQLKDLLGLDLAARAGRHPCRSWWRCGARSAPRSRPRSPSTLSVALRSDRGPAPRAAALAGLPDRGGAGGGSVCCVQPRCRDHRLALRRHPELAARALAAGCSAWEKAQAVLPDALAIALLGSIESLLSAVVADGLTGRRHRSNCELVAQGVGECRLGASSAASA